MVKQTYRTSLQFLVISFIVQSVVLQATGVLSLKNVHISSTGIPSTVTPHEARNSTISNSPGMPTGSSQETENKTTRYNADTSMPVIGNTTNIPLLLSTFAQITHSSHIEASHPSHITAETTREVTDFPTESFASNSTYQSPGNDSKVTTAVTQKDTALPSATSSLSSSKVSLSASANQLPGMFGDELPTHVYV